MAGIENDRKSGQVDLVEHPRMGCNENCAVIGNRVGGIPRLAFESVASHSKHGDEWIVVGNGDSQVPQLLND
jgi:hypothetical protein